MQIGIVGLGLIGGSLGLDLRRQGHFVIGMSRRSTTGEQALAMGAIDHFTADPADLAETDVVFLCTPLDVLMTAAAEVIPSLSAQTLLTDVGSAKATIVSGLESLWPNFVGGHPMAGKAESGIAVAQANLFAGNPYVLTPTERTPQKAIEILETIVQSLEAQFYTCSPEEHDRAVAWISHLPVMISATLIQACLTESEPRVFALAQQLASSGFRDTSRVGGGDPHLGLMMARYNQAALLKSLHQYRTELETLTQKIEQQNWSGLAEMLGQTQAARPDFL